MTQRTATMESEIGIMGPQDQKQTFAPAASEKKRLLSFILPVMDEEGNLEELYAKLTDALKRRDDDYEMIFVDDGSKDGSFLVMTELQKKDERVRVIKFRRNFGKAAAYSAGFEHARGDVFITMDADLQDDPDDLEKVLEKLDEGYDMVNGWKFEGKGPADKSIPSKLFNKVISKVTGIKLNDFNCPFKAYRREVLDEINVYGELHRFIPVLAHAKGFTIAEVPIKNLPRKYGKSKYGIGRFQRGLLDTLTVVFLTRFGQRPLHFLGIGGMAVGGLGAGILGFLITAHIMFRLGVTTNTDWNIHDRPILNLGILLMIVGIQFFSMGLLGELFITKSHASSGNGSYSIARVVEKT